MDITATFYRSLPFDAQAYERAYELFEKAILFQPKKFGEYEPLKTKWGYKKAFKDLCHENSKLHFSSIIIEGVRNKQFAMLVGLYGPKANHHFLSLSCIGKDGMEVDDIMFMDLVFDELGFDYGYICCKDEYEYKNIDKEHLREDGTVQLNRVVGLGWPECVPGVYWCNYFGNIYFEQGMPKDFAGIDIVCPLRNGVRLMNVGPPDQWRSESQIRNSSRIEHQLTTDWFFSRETGMPKRGLRTDVSKFRNPPSEQLA